jgi:very-short-patch-repair endonuclease
MANIMLSYWYRLYTKQTKHEQLLEAEICKLGVRYRSQHIVIAAKAILDFYLPDYNLCIEVDDISHEKKTKKDRLRTERLAGLGIKVIRFTNRQVESQLDKVLAGIRAEIVRSDLIATEPILS